jgi:hypothetical protein
MFNCLAGCVKSYEGNQNRLHKTLNEEVLMPWVEVWIKDDNGTRIAVSNISGRNNLATIKSFQFGISNGNGVTVEIVDEMNSNGGSFRKFFEKISTGNAEAGKEKYFFNFRFGWAAMECGGNGRTFGPEFICPSSSQGVNNAYMSGTYTMTIHAITVNASGGMFKYIIEASDMTISMFTTTSFDTQGTESKPIPVTQAIRELFAKWNVDVKFLQMNSSCMQPTPMQFKVVNSAGNTGGNPATDGPVGRWRSVGRNPIQAAREWLNPFVTQKGRGIVTFWDLRSNQTRPCLVFMEANIPSCNEKVYDRTKYNLGTYLVNGGNCSPVISFTPDIKYDMGTAYANTGGTVGSGLMAGAFREKDPCMSRNTNTKNQGMQKPLIPSDDLFAIIGNKVTSLIEVSRNYLENIRDNVIRPGITAELKIQGDPSYSSPYLLLGSYITIVYINPFRIGDEGNGCDFLDNGCQQQLSNKNWFIQKISHEIRNGSFTTTLRVLLAAPGQQMAQHVQVGASPAGPFIG